MKCKRMAGTEFWIVATCRGEGGNVFWEIYKMGFKHIGIALTVMLGFTRYTSVYFNILYHFFMS